MKKIWIVIIIVVVAGLAYFFIQSGKQTDVPTSGMPVPGSNVSDTEVNSGMPVPGSNAPETIVQ